MPLSSSRDYLSIGEVLEAIRDEFPDISISKIRFLENEGLIAPERTESGYRKFYDDDVARLRYILSLQRDQFLPLKVIKQRLAGDEPRDGALPTPTARSALGNESQRRRDDGPDPEASLSRAELRTSSGLSDEQLAQLEDFGILARRGEAPYSAQDLEVARTAAAFLAFGVEPRHLRMFRQAADRESALVEQIVAPLKRRQRSEGRREVAQTVTKLGDLSRRMHEALLGSALADLR